MTTYNKATNFATKDALLTGNPSKIVKGTEIDAEFTAIQAADVDNLKISDLGTGVETALGVNIGSAGAPVLFNGAAGTPTSGTLTNCTGLPSTGFTFLQAGTGATSRTGQAKLREVVSIKDFGAVGDGVTDDTVAIKAHITYMNTVGGIAFYPRGIYLYSSATFTSPHDNVTVQGEGKFASIIRATVDGANIFYIWGEGSAIRDIGFDSSVTQTSGTYIQAAGTWNLIDSVSMDGDHTGILVSGVGTRINNVVFNNGASGGVRITFDCGDSSPHMTNVIAAAQSAPYPTAGVRLKNVTALKVSDCDFINQGIDLLVNPTTSESVLDCKFTQCFFDSATNGISIKPTGTGTVGRLRFISCWTGTATASGTVIDNGGTGYVKGIEFIGHESGVCGGNGIYAIGTNVTDISIIGGVFGGNTGDGIRLEHAGSAKVVGVDSGDYHYLGVNTGVGAFLGVALTQLIFKNNRLLNNTAGSLTDNTGSIVKFISDYDVTGYAKVGSITVTASPFTYTPSFDQTVYVTSGTVSGIVVGGVTTHVATNATLRLRKGQSVQVTYTGTIYMSYTA